jgi:hypothetical protein
MAKLPQPLGLRAEPWSEPRLVEVFRTDEQLRRVREPVRPRKPPQQPALGPGEPMGAAEAAKQPPRAVRAPAPPAERRHLQDRPQADEQGRDEDESQQDSLLLAGGGPPVDGIGQ